MHGTIPDTLRRKGTPSHPNNIFYSKHYKFQVDVCCFDKTGTLTSDHLVVEGVALINHKSSPARVTPASDVPVETSQVLATCHSLAHLDDGLVGDPLEKATLSAVDWTLTRADAVIPKKGKSPALKIFHRHHFTSALKRMCVVAGYNAPGGIHFVSLSNKTNMF